MSASSSFVTKAYVNAAWAQVLQSNVLRKALLIGTSGADVKIAFGDDALEADAITLKAGEVLLFDKAVPIDELWAIGNLVVGEVS